MRTETKAHKEKLTLEDNELLFGGSDFKKIVSIEVTEDSKAVVYYLDEDSKTASREFDFEPVILLCEESLVYGAKTKPIEIKRLEGDNFFKYAARYRSAKALDDALKHLFEITGYKPSSDDAPYLHVSDPVHQFMLTSGNTCFKSMRFSDLRRLTIDIETDCADEFDFSNAKRESDRILLIGAHFSGAPGKVEFASAKDMSEKEMLEWLSGIVEKYDPDTIEGHNIFKFDLAYIAERAKRHKVKLKWGRDGSDIKFRKSRVQVAERTLDYTRCDIFGRTVVDTWILAQYYDVQTRALESFNLKHLARHFGVAPADRVYIDHSKIKTSFDGDYEAFLKYNKDDIIETAAISEILSYGYFVQSTIFPYSYQNCIVRGNATKINSLFIREYLRRGYSVPKNANRGARMDFEGGYTDIFIEGIVKNVGHCDVRSLYPSIMLTYKIAPAAETRDIFLPMLTTLRDYRVEAKNMMKRSKDGHDKKYYDALQSAFKVLINSFYGYLGSSIHNFSDISAAAEVTRIGRETIIKMVNILKTEKCRPVEIDTDGVYFIPPDGVSDDEGFEKIVAKINASLDPGIEVEYDGRFKAMLSFKMKNYALLDYDGKLSIKGSALKSRGLEKYLRSLTYDMILFMLNDESHKIKKAFDNYYHLIETRKMPIDDICKTETLTESPKAYKLKVDEKKRNPSAQYELALRSGREFQAGDQVSFYITGDNKRVTAYTNCKLKEQFDEKNPDYNAAYYIDKLNSQYQKFAGIAEVPSAPSSKGEDRNQGELF